MIRVSSHSIAGMTVLMVTSQVMGDKEIWPAEKLKPLIYFHDSLSQMIMSAWPPVKYCYMIILFASYLHIVFSYACFASASFK